MLVRDWMTPAPHTVQPDTPVLEALKLMTEKGFRRLPVMQGSKLVGIVTAKDLKDAMPSKATTLSVWELNYLLSKLTVSEVMARPVITAREDEHMEDAALRLQEHRVGGMPVLSSSGELRGIITITDVLRAFIEIMGLKEGGYRLTLDMPDVPGSLERAAGAVKPSNIMSVATAGSRGGNRRFVMRVVGEGARSAADRVSAAGIEVVEAQEKTPS
ncbi:acetoin utilization protein AcuB [Deinobacterium chartae]|uniref:Acetoin utilization protein AcuB n=1 Tax=Deinobacterium chartae TaxID=521158 RepID=A0A841HXD6_9DEIO|nr:CBS and ACT domain-containing protein [Deinobacterium chartae]MBB6097314.1 acetoin utilization protein AcuB [Deinobacterium chartae]